MAITQSAKKAERASLRKRVFNRRNKDSVKDSLKVFLAAVAAGDKKAATAAVPAAYASIDKAVKRGVIKRNNGDRKKSQVATRLAALTK